MKTSNNRRHTNWVVWIQTTTSLLTCLLAGQVSAEPTNFASASNTEALVIIVNKANPVETLTTEELRKYFRLERERWADGRKNTVLMLPSGTGERETVLRLIYQLDDSEFTRHFLQATYAGRIHSVPKELVSATNVRKFVFNVPGAIGYVRASQVDDTVKVVRIDGHLPGDADYPLKLALK
jgi:ABC-type phosphate transport system substrate-binding protein